jgi:hypothetical protein
MCTIKAKMQKVIKMTLEIAGLKKNNTGKIQKTLSGTVKWSVRYKPNSKKKRCIYM